MFITGLYHWLRFELGPERSDDAKLVLQFPAARLIPKLMVWSEKSHDFREVQEEHLVYNEKLNEVRIVLDEIHGE